jgi:N-sulfoglucosamine sulfohydrolase
MNRYCWILIASSFGFFGAGNGQVLSKKSQPNILWITCEDMSPHLGSYGDLQVKTPNLDKLALDGIRYTKAFATAGVCAPSRSAIITGMYQQSIGTQHMRTGKLSANKDAYPPNYIGYSAVVPSNVKCFPEYLRANGYYCTNNVKEDYQFEAPPTVWDESSNKAHWRNRRDSAQRFFAVFNLMATHESQVWSRAGEPLLVDPKNVEVPPYYPDVPEVRNDIARHLSNVMVMDQQAGAILKQLEEDGLSDNTIVFFFSDHGDGLPFVKREIYDRGTRVPLIIKFGKKYESLNPFGAKRNVVDHQLINLVDLAPTVLSLTGSPIPDHLQGQAFLGPENGLPRSYVYAARDRMDSEYDRVRSIRNNQFLYLRNYMTEKPYYQNISYRLQQPMMKVILQMRDQGKLNEKQMLWFRQTKPAEELYDCVADPFQFNNLASHPAYTKTLTALRKAYDEWIIRVGDLSEMTEQEMLDKWWNGKAQAPKTETPVITYNGSIVKLTLPTIGASIGYKFYWKDTWSVFTTQIETQGHDSLYVVAQRIGYQKSEVVREVLKKQ